MYETWTERKTKPDASEKSYRTERGLFGQR